MSYGSGSYKYTLAKGWGILPEGYEYNQVAAIGVDKEDNLYVFNRGDHQLMILDNKGILLDKWSDFFANPHGLHVGPDQNIYLVDRDSHTVLKYSPNGKLLLTLGQKDVPSDTGYEGGESLVPRPAGPFNLPTGIAVNDSGDIFVSDGYGNCRFHRFTSDGSLVDTWGQSGKTNPLDFHLPHGIAIDNEGRLAICDRENNRIQFVDQDGEFLFIWEDLIQPTDITFGTMGEAYISELQHRISIMDQSGQLVARWGEDSGHEPSLFVAPHCIAIDSQGDIYVGEVGEVPEDRRIQKFIRTD